MRNRWIIIYSIFFIFFSPYCFSETVEIPLKKKIEQIADAYHCKVGAAAIHIESSRKVAYQGDVPFFMASTVKVPIALALLKRVDNHQDTLDRKVHLTKRDSVPGSGILFYELNKNPQHHSFSLQQLLHYMLTISDNTASDLLLQEAQGSTAIKRQLIRWGFRHILVDRSIYDMYIYSTGTAAYRLKLHDNHTLDKVLANMSPKRKVQAWKRFEQDIRDTTTPNEMALLLAELYRGALLSASSTNILLNTMHACKTGQHRLKGLLPEGTPVAHKTGTWTISMNDKFIHYPGAKQLYRSASDVGIVTLPQNKGHLAVAIYVKSTAASSKNRELVIAKISRALYDYFLYMH